VRPGDNTSSVPNPLPERDPQLAGRPAAFRDRVNSLLFDWLAADALQDPALRVGQCPHAFEDLRAVALTLRVLTKPSWDAGDMRRIDACWHTASRSGLFAEGFEAERHRLGRHVEDARASPAAGAGVAAPVVRRLTTACVCATAAGGIHPARRRAWPDAQTTPDPDPGN
jgi:hypothetical protein